MALNPEYLYPNRPMHFKGVNDTLGIGLAVTDMPPNPNGWGGTDTKVTFTDVRTVDLSGFPDTSVDVELFEFINGLKLKFTTKIENNIIWGKFYLEYNNTESSWGLGGWTPRKMDQLPLDLWGDLTDCKFYAATQYLQPVDGITPAIAVYFDVMIPGKRTRQDPYAIISEADLHQVNPGNSAWIATDICWCESLLPIAPPDHFRTGIGTWFNPNGVPGSQTLITDLDAFNTFMKTAGRGTNGKDIYDNDEDPAGTDDPSHPGGGGGNYDPSSDPIDFPDLPTGGALECGAVKAHRVSKLTLEAIMQKLWDNSLFNIQNMWQKSISDPMDAIVSLHALPISPAVGTADEIWIGNFDTDLTSPPVTSQYLEVDCGSLNVKEFWGSALDYSPYTRAEIYLPFIGVKDVAIEDVMNSTVHIKYHVDVLTGDCIAFIKCGQSVLYHFTGNCRMTIPLSSYTTDALQTTIGETGKMLTAGAIGAAVGGGAGAMAGVTISSAANVASSKIRLNKGSDVSGSLSVMDDFTPYFIFHRPIQSLAKNYNKFKGYPSNITATLGSVSGYTEVEHIHLQNIPNATSEEMEEIVSLLKTGVLL